MLPSLFAAISLLVTVSSVSLEWCEYWTLLNQRDTHPECSLFLHSKEDILRRLGRMPALAPSSSESSLLPPSSPVAHAPPSTFWTSTIHPFDLPVLSPPKCERDSEVVDCLECEATCSVLNPECRRDESCSRGCVCAPGLLRDSSGGCVAIAHCPVLPDEKEARQYLENLKRVMPVIVNDLFKMVFGPEQPAPSISATPQLLSSFFSDYLQRKKSH